MVFQWHQMPLFPLLKAFPFNDDLCTFAKISLKNDY